MGVEISLIVGLKLWVKGSYFPILLIPSDQYVE